MSHNTTSEKVSFLHFVCIAQSREYLTIICIFCICDNNVNIDRSYFSISRRWLFPYGKQCNDPRVSLSAGGLTYIFVYQGPNVREQLLCFLILSAGLLNKSKYHLEDAARSIVLIFLIEHSTLVCQSTQQGE